MGRETSGDTSGSDGGCSRAAAAQQESTQSVSGVTEAGTSGNAAAGMSGEKARRHGGEDDGVLTVMEKAVYDDDDVDVDWEVVGEVTTADGDDVVASSSPVRRTAARLGWLLLGFLAGAAVAAAVLFMTRHEYPVTCTLVPT
jgi:hypothetical protein